jgi:transposase
MASDEMGRLRDVITKIEAEKAEENQRNFTFEESLKVLRKKFFGKSSEKSPKDHPRDRASDEPELTVHSQNLLPPLGKKKTRDLPVEERLHEASREDLVSMSKSLGLANPSAEQWEEIAGLFEIRSEIEITERSFKTIRHKRKKYRLKSEFALPEKEMIIPAPGPVKLVPGSAYSIEFAVETVTDKYLNHLPLERQCRMMASQGLHGMQTQVLYNLAKLASMHLESVVERIKLEILKRALVHSDETTWPINNSKDSDGYMWIVSNNVGAYYRFEPTRSGKVIKETLGEYKGFVMTDGFSGYNQFRKSEDKRLVQCHSHARRYFWEIKDDNPICEEYLDLYEDLFKLEYLARDFDELKNIREKNSKPIIEKMKKWLIEKYPESRPESLFRKAIDYSLNRWTELTKFLEHPEVPLTNNEAERTIRQAVMGRKNFYGSRSIDGADVAAIMYTIIESCKRVELDPRDYLKITITNSASGKPTETPFEMASRLRQQPG